MGGVPARVVGGFSPGSFSPKRHDYVVRDLDAHSWVEVWFPKYGWVTFDPTPAASPARSQLINLDLPNATAPVGQGGQTPGRGDAPEPGPKVGGGGGGSHGGLGVGTILALMAGAGTLGGLGTLGAKRWRRRHREAPGGDPDLEELRRALRRTGRPLAGGTTLARLEDRFRSDAGAAGYLRALRSRRFGFTAGAPAGTRRDLRRALAQGLGLTGRLRALWALPPRRKPLRRSLH
jgi:transglutaminase superfamily protein